MNPGYSQRNAEEGGRGGDQRDSRNEEDFTQLLALRIQVEDMSKKCMQPLEIKNISPGNKEQGNRKISPEFCH